MRIGRVKGRVVLSHCEQGFCTRRLLVVEPLDEAALRGRKGADRPTVVVIDELGADVGTLVAFSEGREGTMPFLPDKVACDAYAAALLDEVIVR